VVVELDRRRVKELADMALATAWFAASAELGVIVVPDVLMVEAVANGYDTGRPIVLLRADRRIAYVYAIPPELAEELPLRRPDELVAELAELDNGRRPIWRPGHFNGHQYREQ
jgi:hypothetical protein